MSIWPRYLLRLSVGHLRAAPARRRTWLAAAAAAAIGLVAVPAIPASASSNPTNLSVSVSVVPPPVKSVTLSVSSTGYTNCIYGTSTGAQLGFPNGACLAANTITVTNGTAPATIMVNGADMVPQDGGTHWTLEPASNLLYAAPIVPLPGADQYLETVTAVAGTGYDSGPQEAPFPFFTLTNTASCDQAFAQAGGCLTANPGQSLDEFLAMTGPSSSTDPSSTFTTTVTWTAA